MSDRGMKQGDVRNDQENHSVNSQNVLIFLIIITTVCLVVIVELLFGDINRFGKKLSC